MFVIYDETHAEILNGEFETLDSALTELRNISEIPFGEEPNCPPCIDWANCEREYFVHQYDNSTSPWKLLAQMLVLRISAKETLWLFEG